MSKDALTFERLSLVNATRCEAAFHQINDWSPTDWACAMGGECGEALNKVKKLRRLDGADFQLDVRGQREKLKQEILDELADTIIYADLLATRLGGGLEEAIIRKFNEVSDRRDCKIKLPERDLTMRSGNGEHPKD